LYFINLGNSDFIRGQQNIPFLAPGDVTFFFVETEGIYAILMGILAIDFKYIFVG
jgi:hypothetical protein